MIGKTLALAERWSWAEDAGIFNPGTELQDFSSEDQKFLLKMSLAVAGLRLIGFSSALANPIGTEQFRFSKEVE